MSCLVYCIYSGQGPEVLDMTGVGGQTVYLESHDGLGAAVSDTDGFELCPDLEAIQAHARVVAASNLERTVIPMRFGVIMADAARVRRLLQEEAPRYSALLRELAGCVEMGLRLLPPGPGLPGRTQGQKSAPGHAAPGNPPAEPVGARQPGLAYLAARKAHYESQMQQGEACRLLAERYLAHFAGLFVQFRWEGPRGRWPLLSLYFLVPRPRLMEFRQVFGRLKDRAPENLILSGPWPPYNFVAGDPAAKGLGL